MTSSDLIILIQTVLSTIGVTIVAIVAIIVMYRMNKLQVQNKNTKQDVKEENADDILTLEK